MNFSEFSKKMLLQILKHIRIFIGGNTLAASLFLAFASIYTNHSFMDETIVDPMISSSILFAGVLVALFFAVMILISGRVFWNERKKEYAVMSVLGMSQREAVKNMIRENILVLAGIIPIVFLFGTILSYCFYAVIRYVIGIDGIIWMDNGDGYILTFILYGILSFISIVWNAIIYVKENLALKLKENRLEEDGLFVRFVKRHLPEVWNRFLPQNAFVRLHQRMWNARYGIGSILTCGMLLLIGMCVSLYPSFQDSADIYSPYDMLYTEIYGKNQMSQKEIAEILDENGVDVIEYKQFEYVRNTAFNFIAVSELNTVFQCGYKIHEGECMNLFQIDKTDGYEHDLTPVQTVTLTDDIRLISIGSDIRILWNQNPTFADRTLVVSDKDYSRIKYTDDCSAGKVNLYQFYDWKSSEIAVRKVDEYLQQVNGVDWEEQYYYRTSSRINQYLQAKQSGQFFIFVMSFVVILLLIAVISVSYFGILAEQGEHKRMVEYLYRIGAVGEQVRRYLVFRNRLRYVFPVVVGEMMGFILVMLWNRAAYQMRLSVILTDVVIAGLIILGVWRFSSSKKG
ncbi:MAG: ABC transporter permease [Lachnospiraceae bacterium]|nr:ABC transporter permease [Lachnospiraceae bacterium]